MPNPIAKSLSRLSRDKLVELCILWTKSSRCDPYLSSNRNAVEAEEEDYLHEPARSRKELMLVYASVQNHDVTSELADLSKKDIIDRIIDGDWRRGLSYHQLASIDFANLDEDDTFLRWYALKLVPLEEDSSESRPLRPAKRRRLEHSSHAQKVPAYPNVTASMFVASLKSHISPLVKAHYHIHRIESLRLSVVRLHIQKNVPFAPLSSNVPRQGRSATEASRSMYIAVPDSCPYVYISVSGTVNRVTDKAGSKGPAAKIDLAATKKIILEAIPKAFSRPQQRWSLEATKLTAKSLRTMCLLRGNGEVGSTGGPFSRLSQPTTKSDAPSMKDSSVGEGDNSIIGEQDKSLHEVVQQRFGQMGGPNHASLDRVQIRLQNLYQSSASMGKKRKRREKEHGNDKISESSTMTITLSGSDVFAGLKQFALCHPQFVDMNKLSAVFSGETHRSIMTL